MNVLLLGSGGRECCLAWKISQSDLCKSLFIAPGNGGTDKYGKNIDLDPMDFDAVKQFLYSNNINILIVGPEAPLVKGITNDIKGDSRFSELIVIGPDKQGAKLEGSKAFAKKFMSHYNIPTAIYSEYHASQKTKALQFLDNCKLPIVLKADGLAAGKGVYICHSRELAKKELNSLFEGRFGEASKTVVIEEFLSGREFSVFVLTDGTSYRVLPIAKDYKRIGEGDEGPNTGGMGSVSPVSFADSTLMEKVEERIIKPTVKGITESGYNYLGFIFFGLIEVEGEPYVIEYNCRLGDPETQVVIPRLKNDLLHLFKDAHAGNLHSVEITKELNSAASVIMVSGGYPDSYEKGKLISGIANVKDSLIFHAGTKKDGDQFYTNGGRVLAITSLAKNVDEALKRSYESISKIHFDKSYYRRDIGYDV